MIARCYPRIAGAALALPGLLLASSAMAEGPADGGDAADIKVVGHVDPEGLLPDQSAPRAVSAISADFITKQAPTLNAFQLVGLLPGAGGTQRLPRLIGVEAAMPLLLEGGRLRGEAAIQAGLAHKLVKAGEEIATAEAWLLSVPAPVQPWDREDWVSPSPTDVGAALAPVRRRVLQSSLGHYPALFAILDCVEFGLPQSFEGGMRSEMTSFTHLVLRPEPRAMIQTMFLGRVDYERLERKQQLPDIVAATVAAVRDTLDAAKADADALAAAGFEAMGSVEPVRTGAHAGLWIEGDDARARRALAVVRRIREATAPLALGRGEEELRIADYAAVRQAGYPAYLGGPYAFAAANSVRDA